MGQRPKPGVTRERAAEQEMRDQEVLRANKELAAYFKGRRTDREARAALKIIKAFVRDRERRDARSRPALPGAGAAGAKVAKVAKTPKEVTNRKATSNGGRRERHRQNSPRNAQDPLSKSATAAIGPPMNPQRPQSSESDERAPK
jgi:hypothetical protein